MDSNTRNKYGSENNSNVIELTSNDFTNTKLIHPSFKNKIGLIKIYAPWCGYCTVMNFDMNFLGKSLPKRNIIVGAINYEQNKELVGKIGSKGFPSMFVVDKEGILHEKSMGNRSIMEILNVLKEASR
tara:strand:+ start:6184 stop:6567 length:384 start_codon:yes stop_codon:yes gene_type:complete